MFRQELPLHPAEMMFQQTRIKGIHPKYLTDMGKKKPESKICYVTIENKQIPALQTPFSEPLQGPTTSFPLILDLSHVLSESLTIAEDAAVIAKYSDPQNKE